eukprot:GSA120T00012159001.1
MWKNTTSSSTSTSKTDCKRTTVVDLALAVFKYFVDDQNFDLEKLEGLKLCPVGNETVRVFDSQKPVVCGRTSYAREVAQSLQSSMVLHPDAVAILLNVSAGTV